MKKLLIILISSIFIVLSCDKIDNPIPSGSIDTEGINFEDSAYTVSSTTMKKILVEEFTGHLCTACPNGSREIERLDSIYEEQLIPVSIHAGSFAVAIPNTDFNGDLVNDFTEDFTNSAGEIYFSSFGVSSNPSATVSRINNANITGLSQWSTDISSIAGDVPKVKIGLSVLYDDSSRTVKAIANTSWLSSETGTFKLQIYLVEDSIVNWQLDNGVYEELYTHRHVFRTTLNGTWGSNIPSSNSGDNDTQDFSLALSPIWDVKHCSIIAFVYRDSPQYEIIQAEELHITNH